LKDFDFCEVVTDYVEEERWMNCFHCQICAGTGSAGMTTQGGALLDNDFVSGLNVSSTWICKGWEKLWKHTNLKHHLDTIDILKKAKSPTHIGHMVKDIGQSLKDCNRKYILQILSIIVMLAIGGQAFRGHNKSDDSSNWGNFLNTLDLLRRVMQSLMKSLRLYQTMLSI
jgi:hypothetical protein